MELADDARLVARVEIREATDLTPHEAFLLSQLSSGPLTVGHVRRTFGGLGFEVMEVLDILLQRGYIAVTATNPASSAVILPAHKSAPPATSPRTNRPASGSQPRMEREPERIPASRHGAPLPTSAEARRSPGPSSPPTNGDDWVDEFSATRKDQSIPHGLRAASSPASRSTPTTGMHRVGRSSSLGLGALDLSEPTEVFDALHARVSEGDWSSAIDLLERALQVCPREADYMHRLAQVHLRVGDLEAALSVVRDARQLADSASLRSLQEQVEARIARRGCTRIYAVDWPGCETRFLRIEPRVRRLWVELRWKDRRGIGSIDLETGRMDSLDYAKNPESNGVVLSDHPRLAGLAERSSSPRLRVGTGATRSSLLDQMRRTGDAGPWFRNGPSPLISSSNSLYLLFDRNPDSPLEEGLFTLMDGSSTAVRIDPDLADLQCVRFSPGDDAIAWTGRAPGKRTWGVYLSTPLSRGVMKQKLEGPALLHWDRHGHDVYALDTAQGRLHRVSRLREARFVCRLPVDEVLDFIVDEEVERGVVCGRRGRGYALVWFDLNDGNVHREIATSRPVRPDVLRSDGIMLSARQSGLGILDLSDGRRAHQPFDHLDAVSLRRNTWHRDEPLYVLGRTTDRLEVFAVAVETLLG